MKHWWLCMVAGILLSLETAQGQPFSDAFWPMEAPIRDAEPVMMAGAYVGGVPQDSPAARIDPNTALSPFAGVGSVALNGLMWATAVPVTQRHVLTAGHCVDLDNDGVIDVSPENLKFHLNYGGDSTHVLDISAVAIHPAYTGFNHPALNDDLAILTLSSDLPAGVPVYPLCKRPMVQGDVLTLVGYGRTGYGDLGFRFPLETLTAKRVGKNVADLAFLDDEGVLYPEVYVFDFDGPAPTTNVLGGLTLGNHVETTLGYGDSGGPAFIEEDGQFKLAGINTFIARFIGSAAAPPMFGSAGGGIMLFPAGQWIASQTGLPWTLNTLKLNVQGNPAYVRPGQAVVIDLDALNLAQRVNGVQAFLNFSSSHFSVAAGDVSIAPGGGVWDQLLWSLYTVGGDLDVAVGVDLQSVGGTQADATTATVTLKALAEGSTQVVFRPDLNPDPGLIGTTLFSDENSQTILPVKVDSQTIVIDGTPPSVNVTAPNGGEFLKGGGVFEITWIATDSNQALASISIAYQDEAGWHPIAAGETNDGVYTWTVPVINTAAAGIRVSAADLAGNVGSDESDSLFTIDSEAPRVDRISVTQFGSDLSGGRHALQGPVDIAVTATDNLSGISAPPSVSIVLGGAPQTASFISESPSGTFNYVWVVAADTPNGGAVVSVNGLVDRSQNVAAPAGVPIVINKNQLVGAVSFGTRSTAEYTFPRDVTFVATSSAGEFLASWSVPILFQNAPSSQSASATFTLVDVPDGAGYLSAKTGWHLRVRTAVELDPYGQGSATFELPGGDINGSNSVNILDYSLMKTSWGPGTGGDINGDGFTGILDYSLMKSNWFMVGAAQ